MTDSFYTRQELLGLGFIKLGDNVKISRKTSFYGTSGISIGDNVRIDDFCILSGNITLGNNIHISAYCALYGANGIEIKDYSGVSPRSTIFSAMDDFSGDWLVGPIHPSDTINVTGGKVTIGPFAQIGCGCVVFPDITIGEGCATGAMSLINKSLDPWGIYAGTPASFLKARSRKLKSLAY